MLICFESAFVVYFNSYKYIKTLLANNINEIKLYLGVHLKEFYFKRLNHGILVKAYFVVL